MPFDGTFLFKLNEELQREISSRADKIHQPSGDELVFFLRGFSGTKRLIINLSATPRIYLCDHSPENPATPPRFCTVLRKYLSGARLKSVRMEGFERICFLDFDTFNEMGDEVRYTLILELISSAANAILVNGEGRIIDALRRSDLETAERIIHSGATYRMPTPQNKLNPMLTSAEDLADAASDSNKELWQAVLDATAGASPLIAREIASFVDKDVTKRCEEIENIKEKFVAAFQKFKQMLSAEAKPTLIMRDDKQVDFCWCEIKQFGGDLKPAETLSALCDEFFLQKQKKEQASAKTGELTRYLTTLRARIARKALARRRDLEKCEGAETARIKGELIKANLYAIKKGMESVKLENYYSETLEPMYIELDPSLSAPDNAARYFKEYKKLATARGMLSGLIAESEAELDYIDSVQEALSRAETVAELDAIKSELISEGYIRIIGYRPAKKSTSQPLKFISPEGFEILVGRNNTENDKLTMSVAEKNDIWLHTKDIHGAHVIIRCGGKEADDETLLFAANLAALNSKAKNSSSVPVDYTLARYVKKPSGAKPGAVIYTNQKTLYVTPNEQVTK